MNDLSDKELAGEAAQDKVKWMRLLRNIDRQIKVGKDAEEEEEKEEDDDDNENGDDDGNVYGDGD